MPRTSLIIALATVVALGVSAAPASDPHLDQSVVTGGCPACHAGHGQSDSPMLRSSQRSTCLGCHDSPAGVEAQRAAGRLAQGANPPLIGDDLAQPYQHPVSAEAFSAFDKGAVTCTSCHSPHRASPEGIGTGPRNQPRRAGTGTGQFEYELCETCHSGNDGGGITRTASRQTFGVGTRSFHPIAAAASGRSPSIKPEWSGKLVSCGDCHGSPNGSKGPHGSPIRGLLRAAFATDDGATDPAEAYALCWNCHEQASLFERSSFPPHKLHVESIGTSCKTCHASHSTRANRGLVSIGEDSPPSIGRSLKADRLAFVSDASGSGTCYLTCHGYDHAPASYGLGDTGTTAARTSTSSGAVPHRPLGGTPGTRPSRGVPAEPRAPRSRDPLLPGDRP